MHMNICLSGQELRHGGERSKHSLRTGGSAPGADGCPRRECPAHRASLRLAAVCSGPPVLEMHFHGASFVRKRGCGCSVASVWGRAEITAAGPHLGKSQTCRTCARFKLTALVRSVSRNHSAQFRAASRITRIATSNN